MFNRLRRYIEKNPLLKVEDINFKFHTARIKIGNPIDYKTQPLINDMLKQCFGNKISRLILDLSGIKVISISLIRIIVFQVNEAKKINGAVTICTTDKQIEVIQDGLFVYKNMQVKIKPLFEKMTDVYKERIEKHPLAPEIEVYEKFEKEGKLEQYIGKWIAIYKGEIVAVSSDVGDLCLSAYQKCGYKPILMRKVLSEGKYL